jgi:hypothetical protein
MDTEPKRAFLLILDVDTSNLALRLEENQTLFKLVAVSLGLHAPSCVDPTTDVPLPLDQQVVFLQMDNAGGHGKKQSDY